MNQASPLATQTWQDTAERLQALRENGQVPPAEVEQLLTWLGNTKFDNDWFWVGQVAAILIRDHASPQLKERVRSLCESADGWPLYFYLMILGHEAELPGLERHVARAAGAKEMTIRLFAEELRSRAQAAG